MVLQENREAITREFFFFLIVEQCFTQGKKSRAAEALGENV